jgi:radical SAM protein with 4Fe4S-binding SPASM domain
MVVDSDFVRLLGELDGSRTLGEILASHAEWSAWKDIAVDAVRSFLRLGIITNGPHGRRTRHSEPAETPRIENVSVNVTRNCNLQCRHCYSAEFSRDAPPEEMTADDVSRVLTQARQLTSEQPSLTLLGGEPLLRPEKVLAVAARAVELGYKPLVSTNGTLISASFARGAERIGLEVQVSLDGHSAALHDLVRGRGVFDRAMDGIRVLVDNGAYTILSLVCHKENVPHLRDFYSLALSLGVAEARFIPLKPMGRAKQWHVEPASIGEILAAGLSAFEAAPAFVGLAGRDCLSIMATTCRLASPRTSCGTGLQTFLLDSDGSVYPCPNTAFPEFRVGNVRDAGFDLERIWEESAVLKDVRRTTAIDAIEPDCADCPVRHWCLGGCRGEAYVHTGSLGGRPPNCEDLFGAVVEMLWAIAEGSDLAEASVLSY